MKQIIIALSLILVVLVVIAGVLLLGLDRMVQTDYNETTAGTTSLSEESIEPETTEPTASITESTTEEQPVLEVSDAGYVLNGVTLDVFSYEGTPVVSAVQFLSVAGLDSDGCAHASDKERVQLTDTSITIGELTSELVVDGVLYISLPDACAEMDYPAYELDGITYFTPSARSFEIPENVNVPVLMYHAVSDDCWGIEELFVSPSDMEDQLRYISENGYDAIWFEDLAHVEDYEKPIILTFDDGYDDNYTELFPLLQKYNIKATIFVIGNAPDVVQHKMTSAQIRELSDSGLVSIQSHSYTHVDMDTLDEDGTEYEMSESRDAITRITGKVPTVLCYPTGKYNDATLSLIDDYYQFGIKMVGGLYNTSDDPHLVNRYYISRYTSLSTFANYLSFAGT